MIPLMMARRRLLVVAGGDGGGFTGFTESRSSTDNTSTYNFTDCNLGEPDPDRYIIVAVTSALFSVLPTINAVTINGVSATQLATRSFGGARVAFWVANVPEGATGTITVQMSATSNDCDIAIYRAVGLPSTTPADTASAGQGGSTDPITVTIDVPAGGFAIGAGTSSVTDGTATWTGLDKDMEFGRDMSTGSKSFETQQVGLSVVFGKAGGVSSEKQILVLSWGL